MIGFSEWYCRHCNQRMWIPSGFEMSKCPLCSKRQLTLTLRKHGNTMNTVNKPWGHEDILLSEPGYKVKRITVNPGHEISLQRHSKREEHWVVVQGIGVFWGPDFTYETPTKEVVRPKILEQGHHAYIGLNETHKVQCAGVTPLVIIEVQRGQCNDEDIVRLDDPYDRDEYGFQGRN